MTPIARPSYSRFCLTPQGRRAIAPTLLVPVTLAMLMIAGPLLPTRSAAEEAAPNAAVAEGDSSVGSRSAATAWRFTKDGAKQIVVTPEQKARQAARKARRAQRHAAEKAAAAAKAASDAGKPGVIAPAAAVAAEKTKEASKDAPPSGKAGDNVNGTGGAE